VSLLRGRPLALAAWIAVALLPTFAGSAPAWNVYMVIWPASMLP
jgi:flagellar motor component MotA